jgi:hypothetical protein
VWIGLRNVSAGASSEGVSRIAAGVQAIDLSQERGLDAESASEDGAGGSPNQAANGDGGHAADVDLRANEQQQLQEHQQQQSEEQQEAEDGQGWEVAASSRAAARRKQRKVCTCCRCCSAAISVAVSAVMQLHCWLCWPTQHRCLLGGGLTGGRDCEQDRQYHQRQAWREEAAAAQADQDQAAGAFDALTPAFGVHPVH